MRALFVLVIIVPAFSTLLTLPKGVTGPRVLELSNRVRDLEVKQQNLEKYIKELVESTISEAITAVRQDFKTNGVQLGNRWRIAEEGTGSYEALVFRDLTSSRTVDRRYAFFRGRYVDL